MSRQQVDSSAFLFSLPALNQPAYNNILEILKICLGLMRPQTMKDVWIFQQTELLHWNINTSTVFFFFFFFFSPSVHLHFFHDLETDSNVLELRSDASHLRSRRCRTAQSAAAAANKERHHFNSPNQTPNPERGSEVGGEQRHNKVTVFFTRTLRRVPVFFQSQLGAKKPFV